MDPNLLRDHLNKLHEELNAASHVDPQSHRLLGEIMDDIKRLLERSPTNSSATADLSPSSPTVSDAAASLPGRLERIAVQFEVDHPTLAASSRRLVDLLGKVGL